VPRRSLAIGDLRLPLVASELLCSGDGEAQQ
jgi:hypothetical protein